MAKKKETVVETEKKEFDIETFKKEIDEYLEVQQDNIMKDVSNKVNEQIETSVNKRMKEEEKKLIKGKNVKIIKRDFFIIMLLILIGYFAYCLYDVDYFHIRTKIVEKEPDNSSDVDDKDNKDQDELNKPQEVVKDTLYYVSNYGYLLDYLELNDTGFLQLFTNGTITNDLKLKLAYKNLSEDKIIIDNGMITFKPDDLLLSLKKVFGEDVTLDNQMFTYNNLTFMYYNDTYIGLNNTIENLGYTYQVIDAKEEGDALLFTVIVGRVLDDQLYNEKNELIVSGYNHEDIKNFQSQFAKFVLRYQKTTGDYTLVSISYE